LGRTGIERGRRLRVINLGSDAAQQKVSTDIDVHDKERVTEMPRVRSEEGYMVS